MGITSPYNKVLEGIRREFLTRRNKLSNNSLAPTSTNRSQESVQEGNNSNDVTADISEMVESEEENSCDAVVDSCEMDRENPDGESAKQESTCSVIANISKMTRGDPDGEAVKEISFCGVLAKISKISRGVPDGELADEHGCGVVAKISRLKLGNPDGESVKVVSSCDVIAKVSKKIRGSPDGGYPDKFSTKGRWYWKNKTARRWVMFNDANNVKLDNRCSRGKLETILYENNAWYRVIYSSMRMQKINLIEQTSVIKSAIPPGYESSDEEESEEIFTVHHTQDIGNNVDKGLQQVSPNREFRMCRCPNCGAVLFGSPDFPLPRRPNRFRRKKWHRSSETKDGCIPGWSSASSGYKSQNSLAYGSEYESTEDDMGANSTNRHRGKRPSKSPQDLPKMSTNNPIKRENDHMLQALGALWKNVSRFRLPTAAQQREGKSALLLPAQGSEMNTRNRTILRWVDKKEHKKLYKNRKYIGVRDHTRYFDQVSLVIRGSVDYNDSQFVNVSRARKGKMRRPKRHKLKSLHSKWRDKRLTKQFLGRRREITSRYAKNGNSRSVAGENDPSSPDDSSTDTSSDSSTDDAIKSSKNRYRKKTPLQHRKDCEELSVRQAVNQGNLRMLQGFMESGEHIPKSDFYPLHTAVTLGMKRTTVFLLQTGEDIERLDDRSESPLKCAKNGQQHALYGYLCKLSCFKDDNGYPNTTATVDIPNLNEDVLSKCQRHIVMVEMERIDLSTKTLYFPSIEFRARSSGQSNNIVFTTPFLSTYKKFCKLYAYGLLYVLAKFTNRSIAGCFASVCLPDRKVMEHRCAQTGLLDVLTWANTKGDTQLDISIPEPPIPWIKETLGRDIDNVKPKLSGDFEVLDDGWTPMHYAVLTKQTDLIEFLLEERKGNVNTKSNFLLPQFILEHLKCQSPFEYHYVYQHVGGLTPLMLATFTENVEAIDLLGREIAEAIDLRDCLAFAYGEETEKHVLKILCEMGEKYAMEKFEIEDLKLRPGYQKENPMARILLGSSDDVFQRIEVNFPPVKIIIDNKNIAKDCYKQTSQLGTKEEIELMKTAIEENAEKLWNMHTELNAIMPGHTSSINGDDTDTVMIVLHCFDKDVIPFAELPYPSHFSVGVNDILVHVVEGFFQFGPLTDISNQATLFPHLQVGQKFTADGMHATLGVFLEDSDTNLGVLTCAHTFHQFIRTYPWQKSTQIPDGVDETFDETSQQIYYIYKTNDGVEAKSTPQVGGSFVPEEEIMEYEDSLGACGGVIPSAACSPPKKEIPECKERKCGYVRRLIFCPDRQTSIDAAVIMFDKDTIAWNPYLHNAHPMATYQLKQAGFQCENDLLFADGEVTNDFGNVVKSGLRTGLTLGLFGYQKIGQVRPNDKFPFPGTFESFILKGQHVIKDNIKKCGDFFSEGDSGSAVFVKKGNSLECLGMAIGRLPLTRETLVTPIDDLLKAINTPGEEYKLKRTSSE